MDFKLPSSNPLAKHFRQPAIYLKLPSQGRFWAEGTLDLPLTGELAILPMSTKDEIVLKTPDALINGQGVVNVIQSCCPSVLNAWAVPNVDIDSILIAIRIASYGNVMDVTSFCPHCEAENDYAVDLTTVLGGVSMPDYSKKVEFDSFKIKLKPATYFAVNQANQIAFEEQQILKSLAAIEAENQEAVAEFEAHLANLINLSVSNLAASTEYIELNDSSVVDNEDYIKEFYQNCDTKVIKAVQSQLAKFAESGGIKPIHVNCNSCTKEFDVNLTFDYASFFASGS